MNKELDDAIYSFNWATTTHGDIHYPVGVPNGRYPLVYNYMDGVDFVSCDTVEVRDERFYDPNYVKRVAVKLRLKAGYWGSFLESMDFRDGKFHLCFGS